MPAPLVFAGMFVLSLGAWALVLRTAVAPLLRSLPPRRVLVLLALPQCFRHVSAALLIPGVAHEGLPAGFVHWLVGGDVLTAALAMASVVALRRGATFAIPLTWVLHGVGLADLLKNVIHGMSLGVADHFGAAAFVPTMLVPLMLSLHLWSLAVLVSHRRAARASG